MATVQKTIDVNKSKLIVLEGCDGSGKTLQATLLYHFYTTQGFALQEREPTGSNIGKWIRKELKGEKMSVRDIQLLFLANRVEHFERMNADYQHMIERDGTPFIIQDRGEPSTAAYAETSGGQLTLEEVIDLHRRANLQKPDIVLFLRTDADVAAKRRKLRVDGKERFDDLDKQVKIAAAYEKLGSMGVYNWVDVDANGSIEDVHFKIIDVLEERDLLPKQKDTSRVSLQQWKDNFRDWLQRFEENQRLHGSALFPPPEAGVHPAQ